MLCGLFNKGPPKTGGKAKADAKKSPEKKDAKPATSTDAALTEKSDSAKSADTPPTNDTSTNAKAKSKSKPEPKPKPKPEPKKKPEPKPKPEPKKKPGPKPKPEKQQKGKSKPDPKKSPKETTPPATDASKTAGSSSTSNGATPSATTDVSKPAVPAASVDKSKTKPDVKTATVPPAASTAALVPAVAPGSTAVPNPPAANTLATAGSGTNPITVPASTSLAPASSLPTSPSPPASLTLSPALAPAAAPTSTPGTSIPSVTASAPASSTPPIPSSTPTPPVSSPTPGSPVPPAASVTPGTPVPPASSIIPPSPVPLPLSFTPASPVPPALAPVDNAPTVVFFGSTGVGKSSVINMLGSDPEHEAEIAEVASSAGGVTRGVKEYSKIIQGRRVRVFDTAGLGEGPSGTVPTDQAIQAFYDLLTKHTPGINLIVLVIRAGRLTTAEQNNYDLIRLLCGTSLPVALVVTSLDHENNIDGWWQKQDKAVRDRFQFTDHACIISTRGLGDILLERYNASKPKVEALIAKSLSPQPILVHPNDWFGKFVVDVRAIISRSEEEFHRKLELLLQRYSIPKSKARWFSRTVKDPAAMKEANAKNKSAKDSKAAKEKAAKAKAKADKAKASKPKK